MSNQTVPITNPIAISGLSDLQAHLSAISSDPSLPFNPKLFDHVELQLTEENIPSLHPLLLIPLSSILLTTTQDPSPAISLTSKLLSPIPFPQILTLCPPDSLILGLESPLPGAILLSLVAVRSAAKDPAHVSLLTTLPTLVSHIITAWLQTEDVSVGEKAGKVIVDLLATNLSSPTANGHTTTTTATSLWNLILQDATNLPTIKSLCTPSANRPLRSTTLSQGRLLRLLPHLATLSLPPLLTPAPNQEIALLPWAALHMIDRSDELMRLNLVDFYQGLISVMRTAPTRNAEADEMLAGLLREGMALDGDLEREVRALPGMTIEEEAEELRVYINQLLG